MIVRLHTLGGLRGTLDNAEQDWLASQSMRAALLTYVALERVCTRDVLQTLLWPETDARLASKRLNQSIFELRRTLGDECIQTKGRNIEAGECLTADAVDFERAVQASQYEAAIEQYRGSFLAGVHLVSTPQFESWVDARRARHARLFRKSCRALMEERSASGDVARMQSVAEAWVAGDPTDDEAQRHLIRALALSGNRAEALKQFEAYARLLEAEGLEPLEETRELVAALERMPSPAPAVAANMTAAAETSPRSPAADAINVFGNAPLTRRGRSIRAATDIDPLLENDLLPHFEILRTLGSGATARVYLARDTALQRLVALKVLRPEFASDAIGRARFEREARAAARLSHDNIVAVHHVAALSDGTPYLVMEYVAGRNLADTLAAEGAVGEAEACSILKQLAAALDAAHSRGLIHRDVQPSNVVWIRETGRCVLMDFGIVAAVESGTQASARLTMSGELIGDPAFNSPEQLRSDPVTPATDLYSLAVLAYQIQTRRGPYDAASPAELIQAHLNRTPTSLTTLRPGTSPALADLLLRCLSKTPEHRPSAREVLRALEQLNEPTQAVPPGMTQPVGAATSARGPVFREFLRDAKRRGIHGVALVYLGASLVMIAGVKLFLPSFSSSQLYVASLWVVLSGFPLALVLAWLFDFTSTGIYRTAIIEAGAARVQRRVLALIGLAISIALAALIGWWAL